MTDRDRSTPALPLQRGSLVVMTIMAHRIHQGGWTVRMLHRHSGERTMCPTVDHYVDLSSLEFAQLLEDSLATANGRFDPLDGRCTPSRGDPTGASSSAG